MLIWKGFGRRHHGIIEALPQNLPGGTEENHKKSQFG
jgi:hypothetical protein